MILLLRLSPAIPFNLLNYAMSLTSINFFFYALGSWLGMAPGTFMYVYVSWATINVASNTDQAELAKTILTYVGGGIATILVVVLVTIFAKREINKALEEEEEQENARLKDDKDPGSDYIGDGESKIVINKQKETNNNLGS